MRALKHKVAAITGGANGIGFAMAEALGREGCRVFLLDLHLSSLSAAIARLTALGIDADGAVLDVRSRDAVAQAARQVVARFGKVHILCNNAGVSAIAPIGQLKPADWEWVHEVNAAGVIYGVEEFLPLMESHREGGHIVNTASMAALLSPPETEAYSGPKAAVLAMSEGWAAQLAPRGIGMSVLFPGLVNTGIADSARLNYAESGGTITDSSQHPMFARVKEFGAPASLIGQRVVEAIRDDEFYIFTHIEYRDLVAKRFEAILAAYDRAAASPACAVIAQAYKQADATAE